VHSERNNVRLLLIHARTRRSHGNSGVPSRTSADYCLASVTPMADPYLASPALEMAMGTRYPKPGGFLLYYGMGLGQFLYPWVC
jgi:hypothetical protein